MFIDYFIVLFCWTLPLKPQPMKLPEEHFVSSGLKVTTHLSSCLCFASLGAVTLAMTMMWQNLPNQALSGKSCPWWGSLIASSFPSLAWRTCILTTWMRWAWWPIQCAAKSGSSWNFATSWPYIHASVLWKFKYIHHPHASPCIMAYHGLSILLFRSCHISTYNTCIQHHTHIHTCMHTYIHTIHTHIH